MKKKVRRIVAFIMVMVFAVTSCNNKMVVTYAEQSDMVDVETNGMDSIVSTETETNETTEEIDIEEGEENTVTKTEITTDEVTDDTATNGETQEDSTTEVVSDEETQENSTTEVVSDEGTQEDSTTEVVSDEGTQEDSTTEVASDEETQENSTTEGGTENTTQELIDTEEDAIPEIIVETNPDGSTQNFYTISKFSDFEKIRNHPDANFKLMRDIDMSEETAADGEYDCGNGWEPISQFSGIFDGNGYRIIGMHIYGTISDISQVGLFGYLSKKATVRNLGMLETKIDVAAENLDIGAIVGYCAGTVEECYVDGEITVYCNDNVATSNIGGITGYSIGTIQNCFNLTKITAEKGYVGGIVGYCDGYTGFSSAVKNSYNRGEVNAATENDTTYAIGYNYHGTFFNTYYAKEVQESIKGWNSADAFGKCVGQTDMQMQENENLCEDSEIWFIESFANELYEYPQLVNNRYVPVKNIILSELPMKLEYLQGGSFSIDGAEVKISYNRKYICADESDYEVTVTNTQLEDYIQLPDMNVAGEQQVLISYAGKSAIIPILVMETEEVSTTETSNNTVENVTSETVTEDSEMDTSQEPEKDTTDESQISEDNVTSEENEEGTTSEQSFDFGDNATTQSNAQEEMTTSEFVPEEGTTEKDNEDVSQEDKVENETSEYLQDTENTETTEVSEEEKTTQENITEENVTEETTENVESGESTSQDKEETTSQDAEETTTETITDINTEGQVQATEETTESVVKPATSEEIEEEEKTIIVEKGETTEIWYKVSSISDLDKIRYNPSLNYILTKDIDMTQATQQGGEYDTGRGWKPIENFAGNFNGNGYRIIGMNIYGSYKYEYGVDDPALGLFATIPQNSTVENLGMVDVNINVDVSDAYNNKIGAITGENEGNIERCFVTGKIEVSVEYEDGYIGGIAGYNYGTISNAYNLADITCNTTVYQGGICGRNSYNSEIINCYNRGEIIGERGCAIVGSCYGIIQNTYYLKNAGDSIYGWANYNSAYQSDITGQVQGISEQEMKTGNFFSNLTDTWEVDSFCADIYPYPQLKYNRYIRVQDIKMTEVPSKLVYQQGEEFLLAGSKFEITYDTKAVSNMDDVYTIAVAGSQLKNFIIPCDMSEIGSQKVIVNLGGKEVEIPITIKAIPVEEIVFESTEVTVNKSAKLQLSATIKPENATNKSVTWKSDDETIVTVDENGQITGKKNGTATITVTSVANKTCTAKCQVTVKTACTYLGISKKELVLKIGTTEQLTITKTPLDATDTIRWESSNSEVATVKDGKVSACANGEAIITAIAESGKQASCNVIVKQDISTFSIEGLYDEIYTEEEITPNVTVTNGYVILQENVDYTVTYSNNIEPGTATIIITGMGYYEGKLLGHWNIKDDISTFSIEGLYDENYTGKEITPNVTVTNGYDILQENVDYTVTYSNNVEPGTATIIITGMGYYEGKLLGTWNIKKVENDTNSEQSNDTNSEQQNPSSGNQTYQEEQQSNTSNVQNTSNTQTNTANNNSQSQTVKLNKKTASLKVGKSLQLNLFAANGKVKWKSKDKSIATVSSNGLVKAKKMGTTTITATVNGKTYSCKVKVQSIFEPDIWFANSNGGYYIDILGVSGNKMKIDIEMPNLSCSAKTVTIAKNGKTATCKIKCKDKKWHNLTFTIVGSKLKMTETSSCSKKIILDSKQNKKKTVTRKFKYKN